MFDFIGFTTGALAFLLAFVVAGLFTLAFKVIYQIVTPYQERTLIRQGNTAAAIALVGALIGYILPLASALSHTISLLEFAAWAALAGVIQIATFTAVRMIALPDVKARIENGEISIGVYLAGVSIAGLFTSGFVVAMVLLAVLAVLARLKAAGESLGDVRRAPFRTIWRALLIAAPALVLPFIIRSAVGGGVATATDVSTT